MCTVALIYKQDAHFPIMVAANRDESLDRLAALPHWWSLDEGLDFFAPKDELAGGTWIGTNRAGVFVGITNRFMAGRDPLRASRGALVTQALACVSAQRACEKVMQWSASSVNPFHLIIADAQQAFIVWHDESQIHQQSIDAGVHVLTEQSLGAGDLTRERFVHAQCQMLLNTKDISAANLRQILSVQNGRGFADVRVSLPEYNYGTRSSMLIFGDGQGKSLEIISDDEGGFRPGVHGTTYAPLLM